MPHVEFWSNAQHDAYVRERPSPCIHSIYLQLYETTQLPSSNLTLAVTFHLCSAAAPLNQPHCYSQEQEWGLICPVIWQVISGCQGSDEECIQI